MEWVDLAYASLYTIGVPLKGPGESSNLPVSGDGFHRGDRRRMSWRTCSQKLIFQVQ